ncbi:MAG: cell division protein FtsQ [Actinomycetota bacterium]|nr:cell division protein FtsQ [Actinomycetota bacterium]
MSAPGRPDGRSQQRAGGKPAGPSLGRVSAKPAGKPAGKSTGKASRTPGKPKAPGRPGTRPGTVSKVQARFAAGVRRRRRRRAGFVVVVVASGLGAGWVVFASPVLAVRAVEVRGLHRLRAADVEALAATERGRALALASPSAVATKVAALPLVRSVTVERSWPSTLVVTVTEREPIAGVPRGGRIALVDADGVEVQLVAALPAGLPLLEVDVARSGPATLRAAREVADAIPATLRRGVRSVRATSPDGVTFRLADGTTVVWGSSQDGPQKAAALVAVHPRSHGRRVVIDVSAPDAPAVTGD